LQACCATSSPSTTAVIIGSSARASPAKNIVPREDVSGGQSKAGNLAGVLADCGAVHGLFTGRLGVHVSETAFLATTNPSIVTKTSVLKEIRTALNSKHDDVILYYTGHGQDGTGAWCFEEGTTITPAEVIGLHQRSYRHKRLLIITDSCFAGFWHAAALGISGIQVWAASKESTLARDTPEGGPFTRSLLSNVTYSLANHMKLQSYGYDEFASLCRTKTRNPFLELEWMCAEANPFLPPFPCIRWFGLESVASMCWKDSNHCVFPPEVAAARAAAARGDSECN